MVYVSVVVRSAAVIVIVMVVVPEAAIAQSDGDAFPGVHAPADDAYATVALTSFVVAVTATLVVPLGTSAAYDVVLLTNNGVSAPGATARSASVASPGSSTVTTTVYVSVVVRSCAVIVTVIVVAPVAAIAQSDGDAFPGVHAPAVVEYATVALT
jgi:hypothetical protein